MSTKITGTTITTTTGNLDRLNLEGVRAKVIFVSNAYFQDNIGSGGSGGGGTTILVETESSSFNYNSNTTAKANGAVVNFIFEENPGKTGEVLTNPFTITVSANNQILDPEGSFLNEGDTITFLSVISNLRLISDGTYWYLSGDNTLTTVAASNNFVVGTFASNNYLQTQLGGGGDVSNNYLTGTFTSNNYLQAQGYGTGDVSNNYLQAQGYGTGDVSNNYLQAQGYLTTETGDVSNNYIQDRFTSNTFVIQTYTSNNYIQSQGYGTGDVSNNYSTSTYVSNTLFEALKSNSLGHRNLIINGAMRVAQRGASSTGITTAGYYTVDRFKLDFNSSGTWTMDQADVTDLPGFAHSIKLTCTSAKTSLDPANFSLIATSLEGQNLQQLKKGTSAAESFTISFYVKTNKTGTYVLEVGDHDNSYRHIGKSFTVNSSGTWEYKTITFEGDTTGVLDNDNDASLSIIFWLAAGSTYSGGSALQTSWGVLDNPSRAYGNVNLADSTSNYFQITGVQLEVGDTATPFEYRSYGEELDLCQRYYQVIEYSTVGQQDGAYNTDHFSVPFNVMRAEPTLDALTFTKQGHIAGSLTGLGGATINYFNNAVQFLWSSTDSKYRNHGYRVNGSMSLDSEL